MATKFDYELTQTQLNAVSWLAGNSDQTLIINNPTAEAKGLVEHGLFIDITDKYEPGKIPSEARVYAVSPLGIMLFSETRTTIN